LREDQSGRSNLPDIMDFGKFPELQRRDYPLETFEIIGYMLAFMFSRAKKAVNSIASLDYDTLNLVIPKNFAIPSRGARGDKIFSTPLPGGCFQKETYKGFLLEAILFAEHISSVLDIGDEIQLDELRDLFFKYLKELAREKHRSIAYRECCKCTIEPMAVIEDAIRNEAGTTGIYVALDIGAGTTDIGFFLYNDSESKIYLLYENSLDLGGDDVDDKIKELIAEHYSAKGYDFLGNEEFLLERHYLNMEIRNIKKDVVVGGRAEFNPRYVSRSTRLDPIEMNIHDVSNKIKGHLGNLCEFLQKSVHEANSKCSKYRISIPSNISKSGYFDLRSLKKVFLFGGGCRLPIVKEKVSDTFESNVELLKPPRRYASELTEDDYILLAISIGVSKADILIPPFPFPPEPFTWQITTLRDKEVQ